MCVLFRSLYFILFFFFFNDTATTEIYTLSLHDALPISRRSYHREFKRGELQRLAIDIINSSSVPPNNSEIAAEIIRRNGWDVNDGDLLSSMTGKVKVVRRRRMRRQSLALAERAD